MAAAAPTATDPRPPAAMIYKSAFGLTDNPFRPTRALPDVANRATLKDLDVKPLRLHDEPALERLWVPDAGPFAGHLSDFRKRLSLAGYGPDAGEPPLSNFAFLVAGKQGTGKSTLVNAMLKWLLTCSVDPPWVRFVHPPEVIGDAAPELGDYLPGEINRLSTSNDYVCVIVEDLTQSSAPRVLRLFDEVTRDRFVVLFLVTSEERLLYEVTDNSRVRLVPYRTSPLSPDGAVRLLQRRLSCFRDAAYAEQLAAHPLFPFTEDDVRAAVAARTERGEVITLRTFNVSLQRMLEARVFELVDRIENGFDVARLSPAELDGQLLSMEACYAELVA